MLFARVCRHALFVLVNTGSSKLSSMFSVCRSHKSVALAPFSTSPDILFLPDALQRLGRMHAIRSRCRFSGYKAARAYYYHLWIILILLLGPRWTWLLCVLVCVTWSAWGSAQRSLCVCDVHVNETNDRVTLSVLSGLRNTNKQTKKNCLGGQCG